MPAGASTHVCERERSFKLASRRLYVTDPFRDIPEACGTSLAAQATWLTGLDLGAPDRVLWCPAPPGEPHLSWTSTAVANIHWLPGLPAARLAAGHSAGPPARGSALRRRSWTASTGALRCATRQASPLPKRPPCRHLAPDCDCGRSRMCSQHEGLQNLPCLAHPRCRQSSSRTTSVG